MLHIREINYFNWCFNGRGLVAFKALYTISQNVRMDEIWTICYINYWIEISAKILFIFESCFNRELGNIRRKPASVYLICYKLVLRFKQSGMRLSQFRSITRIVLIRLCMFNKRTWIHWIWNEFLQFRLGTNYGDLWYI